MARPYSADTSSARGLNFRRDGQGGETDDSRHLSNQELRQARRETYTKQIEIETALLDTTGRLYNTAKGIGDEVDIHNELLDTLDHNVEHQTSRMQRANFKMKELVYKSNDNCMMICILVLVVLLIVLISL